jgi:hypothetical protein
MTLTTREIEVPAAWLQEPVRDFIRGEAQQRMIFELAMGDLTYRQIGVK